MQNLTSRLFDRWSLRLIPALVFLVPLLFSVDLHDTFDLPKMSLVYAVDLILLALWAWQTFGESENRRNGETEKNSPIPRFPVSPFRTTPLDIPSLVFLVVTLTSTLFSIDRPLSLFGMYRIYVFGLIPLAAFVLLYWLTSQAASPALMQRVQNAALLSAGLAAVYGILQYTGHEMFDRMPLIKDGGVWSSLGNPLYFGAVCMMGLVLAIGKMTGIGESENRRNGDANRSQTIGYFLIAGLLIVGLLLSLSRSAWLGTTVGILFLILQRRFSDSPFHRFSVSFIFLGSLVVGLAFLLPAVRQRASVVFSLSQNSNVARREGWKAGLQVWRQNPWLGSGPDTFTQAFRPHRTLTYLRAAGSGVTQGDAHNDFIQMAATEGTLGLAAMVWVLVAFGYALKRRDGESENRSSSGKNTSPFLRFPVSPIHSGFFAGLIALFIQNQFNFSSVSTTAWAAVWAGLVMTKRRIGETENRGPVAKGILQTFPRFSVSPFLRFLIPSACALAFWFLVITPLRADSLFRESHAFTQFNQPNLALKYCRAAVDLQPRQEAYLTELANADRRLAILSSGETAQRLFDEAWRIAQTLTLQHPFNPDSWNNAGVIAMWLTQLSSLNKRADAEAFFRRAIALDPVFVDAWANLAKWEHLAGHPDRERELWKKVLELEPRHEMARQVLGNT